MANSDLPWYVPLPASSLQHQGYQRNESLLTLAIASWAMIIRTPGFLICQSECSGLIEPARLREAWGGGEGRYRHLWAHLRLCVNALAVAAPSQTGELPFFPATPPWGVCPRTCFQCHLNVVGFCPHWNVLGLGRGKAGSCWCSFSTEALPTLPHLTPLWSRNLP